MVLIALLVTSITALATTVGGILATHKRLAQRSLASTGLAFAAGAILFVSFGEILPHALGSHSGHGGMTTGVEWLVYSSFFLGMALIWGLDQLLHTHHKKPDSSLEAKKRLFRSGVFMAIALALHNIPEGMSVFLVSYYNLAAGIGLALAIALHAIPEGIAVATLVYATTGSRFKAVCWAAFTGGASIVGGLIGVVFMEWFLPTGFTQAMMGLAAGMMVYVAVCELLPAAVRKQTAEHQVTGGAVAGMVTMGLGLLLI